MKIVHVQTYLLNTGNAAYRLHNLMLKFGFDSYMLMYKSSKSHPRIQQIYSRFHLIKYGFNKVLFKIYDYFKIPGTYQFSHIGVGNDISKHEFIQNADIIYLHWISGGFLNLNNIDKLASMGKPIVFFLHDMWAITGGCHHSLECDKYMDNCEYCPMFGGKRKSFASFQFKSKKLLLNSHNNIYFVSPSEWLKKLSLKSKLSKSFHCCCIPNVVDETVFKPINKQLAKRILNIDVNTKVITFGCVSGSSNLFKGLNYLIKALKLLDHNLDIMILIYGSDYNESIVHELNFSVRFMGVVNDEITMMMINNASDVFVSPSLIESFGLTLLENLKCGTPVVGFNTSAIPEIINHLSNGYLAKLGDVNDIAAGIYHVLNCSMETNYNKIFSSNNIALLHSELCDQLFLRTENID